MSSIAEIISELEFARSTLLKSIEGLSKRELTETPIYDKWTIKDVLAHLIGWDRHVIKILPLIVQDRAGEVPGLDVDEHNRQAVAAWQDKSLVDVLAAVQSTHQQILNLIASLDHIEIDRRHERQGRIITIRSYVIDIMMEHERRHAAEIEQWRQDLERAIDPATIKALLQQNRVAFMNILDDLDEDDALAKNVVEEWSISDMVGHVADWEQRILQAAQHIQDPSNPEAPPVGDSSADWLVDWNSMMVAGRAGKSWPENYHYLRRTQMALDDFVAKLKPGDWKLRGPYPWPDDQGTLAELLTQAAEHYTDHLPDLEHWYERKKESQS